MATGRNKVKNRKRAARDNKPAIRQPGKRNRGNPHPPPPPAEHQFKPGQSGNPSGRPKLLGESYKAWLAKINTENITNAEAVALAVGIKALRGDLPAVHEIRSATEGDTLRLQTWQSEMVELLKAGKVTAEEVVRELGLDDARSILVAAGQTIPASAPADKTGSAGGPSVPAV